AQEIQKGERVEVTGSAIRRVDAETAVPVTVIKIDDLKKEGVTTTEQVLARISASQATQATSQSVGLGTGGASFADLRGLGTTKTLVLLNGRRIANNAIDSSAPDLNMIPFAALERVEVLRDGASALYGTDAIGGVINFITRKDFTGGVVTIGADRPISHGGDATNANIAYGFGDLQTDRFNVFGVFDYQKQDPIRASQRAYIDKLQKTSPTTFPGQYNQGGNVQSPVAPGCGAPNGVFLGSLAAGGDKTCGYLYARQVDLIPNTERFSGLLKGTAAISDQLQLNLEYFGAFNRNNTLIAGVPYGALRINPGTPFFPGNGITPLPTAFTLDPAYSAGGGSLPGAVKLRWRDQVSGGRQERTDNTQHRLVFSATGTIVGWDYQAGVAYNENIIKDYITGGYTDGTIVTPAVLNGTINPFGPQTPAGTAVLAGAIRKGQLFEAIGKVSTVDGKVSRDLGDWLGAGTPVAIAIGSEFRYEKFKEVAKVDLATALVSSTGFDPATNNVGARHVAGVYTEMNVPLLKTLDVTGSVRYDKYSDFGSTTNPKLAFRFQPIQQVLFRGSASKGFRAPDLYELNAPVTYTNTANNDSDPTRCPGGNPIPGVSRSDNCAVQFQSQSGGNTALKAETAKNVSIGMVIEPMADLNFSVDYFRIGLQKQIGGLADVTVFAAPAKYASLFHRAPDGHLSTDGSECPGPDCGYVDLRTQNLGGIVTNGVDFSANYRYRPSAAIGTFTVGFNGTWVHKYNYQNEQGGDYIENVGIYSGAGPIFRWQQSLNLGWTYGPVSLGVANRFKTGYSDQNAGDENNRVGSYSVWDIYGTWTPIKVVSLTVGMRNAFDRQAPFSNQSATFQTGYDPRFTDPTGRAFYMRGTYSF
ncbi:MAG: TonB-dependent receptor, partial [Burkholderiaceae bacterium]